jgi:hypothetical protein
MLINIDCNIAPSEEMNSMCVDYYEEQLYIDSCASSGIFLLALKGIFMLEGIRQVNPPMALGMADQGVIGNVDQRSWRQWIMKRCHGIKRFRQIHPISKN